MGEKMRPYDIILELQMCGASLLVDGKFLVVTIPDGRVSDELRRSLDEQVDEVKAAIARRVEIFDRIVAARDKVYHQMAGQIDWATDSEASRGAEHELELCIRNYINGDVMMEAIERAFKEWIRTLKVKSAEQEEDLAAIFD